MTGLASQIIPVGVNSDTSGLRRAFVGFSGSSHFYSEGDLLFAGQENSSPLPDHLTELGFYVDGFSQEPDVFTLRRTEIARRLDSTGKVVLVCGPAFRDGWQRQLGQWLRDRLDVEIEATEPLDQIASVPAAKAYCSAHLAHGVIDGPEGSVVLTHARISTPQVLPLAVRLNVRKCTVVIGFARNKSSALAAAGELFGLAGAEEEFPSYLDALDLAGEPAMRIRLESLEKEREELMQSLERSRDLKRILFYKEHELETEVPLFLSRELGIEARHVPGEREDFVLVRDDGTSWAIGEVKGSGKRGPGRPDVAALDSHRGAADLDDEYPALLVFNSHQAKASLTERDEAVHPDIRKRAADDHIVVVRTLDLVRLKRLELQGKGEATAAFLTAIEGGGGWFEVAANDDWALRTGP